MVSSVAEKTEVIEVPVDSIKIRFRLRAPKEEKIKELADSINTLGLISPITIDSENYLICGFHRLTAVKSLGRATISAIKKDTSKIYGELIEIDENLKRSELNRIEIAEHILKRESLLEKLGVRMKKGGNQYSTGFVTTSELAEQISMSNRVYRLNRQPAFIEEEVRDLLKETPFADNLKDMVKLSTCTPEVQLKICNLLITGTCQTFQRAFVEAKIDDYRKTKPHRVDFNVKERWGIPHSIQRFAKGSSELQSICDLVSKDPELEWVKREGIHFGVTKIPVYGMASSHAEFLVTYYTPEDGLILDSFSGRSTVLLAGLFHGRRVIGYDLCKQNLIKTEKVIKKHFEGVEDRYQLFHSDGIELEELKDYENHLDGVIFDPPYFLNCERYTKNMGEEDSRDLSNVTYEEYMIRMKKHFNHLYRLIKKSDFEKKEFYPVISKVGTARRGTGGILDMSTDFQLAAKESGFVVWDIFYNELHSPWGAVNWERNYINRYTQKNHETNLVFCKF